MQLKTRPRHATINIHIYNSVTNNNDTTKIAKDNNRIILSELQISTTKIIMMQVRYIGYTDWTAK